MSRNPLQQRLISIVEPVCQAAGYELVDLRFVLEQGGWTLRVAIDRPLDEHVDPGEVPADRVDLIDCENLSREVSAVLDVEDPIPQAFHLEVSSPGIDRPMRTAAHFLHFVGSEAKIQLAAGPSWWPARPSGLRFWLGRWPGLTGPRTPGMADGLPTPLPPLMTASQSGTSRAWSMSSIGRRNAVPSHSIRTWPSSTPCRIPLKLRRSPASV